MDSKYRSRKFLFAAFFAAVGTIALVVGKLTGGEFVGLVTSVLGLYSAASVGEQHVARK